VEIGTDAGTITLEVVIDLLYRDDDGLVIVDYKTDAVTAAGLDRKVAFYRPQLVGCALAIRDATGGPLPRCVLVFLTPGGAIERTVDGIAEATTAIPAALGLLREGANAG
jgi:ATP-dependent helicase/nuclease subunit A